MKQIKAEIIADSKCPRGNRITTFVLTYPRIIHGELMTHRMFSRNAASSRAIPFNKMVKHVEEDPFIPIAWQKDHKGMQGTEYSSENVVSLSNIKDNWLKARDLAVRQSRLLNGQNVTKQLCNRLLEPFQWMTTLVTATEFENFFSLRCPQYVDSNGDVHRSRADFINNHAETNNYPHSFPDFLKCNTSQAEIHIQALAESMWDARNESKPNELKEGEWHIPFGDKVGFDSSGKIELIQSSQDDLNINIKVSIARCARISYLNHDGNIDYKKDIDLHDQLLEAKHASAFEHCCRVPSEESYISSIKGNVTVDRDDNIYYSELIDLDITDIKYGWFDNFKGFQSYRNILNM